MSKTIKVWLSKLGSPGKEARLLDGTTMAMIKARPFYKDQDVRIGRKRKPANYKLRDGDVVVGVPEKIVGCDKGPEPHRHNADGTVTYIKKGKRK